MDSSVKSWFKSGSPWIWLNAGAVAVSVVMVIGILFLIAVRGLGHFWPHDVAVFQYIDLASKEARTYVGEFVEQEEI